jgi:hypothetical protein
MIGVVEGGLIRRYFSWNAERGGGMKVVRHCCSRDSATPQVDQLGRCMHFIIDLSTVRLESILAPGWGVAGRATKPITAVLLRT